MVGKWRQFLNCQMEVDMSSVLKQCKKTKNEALGSGGAYSDISLNHRKQ
jgi:hypothetical protein